MCDKYAGEDGALHFENLIRQLMPEYQHSFIYKPFGVCVNIEQGRRERNSLNLLLLFVIV